MTTPALTTSRQCWRRQYIQLPQWEQSKVSNQKTYSTLLMVTAVVAPVTKWAYRVHQKDGNWSTLNSGWLKLRVKYIFVYFYFDYKIKGSMHSSVYLPNRHKRVKLIAMSSVPTALGNPELRQMEVLDNGRNANNMEGRTQGQWEYFLNMAASVLSNFLLSVQKFSYSCCSKHLAVEVIRTFCRNAFQ